jgi:hypothetical protein
LSFPATCRLPYLTVGSPWQARRLRLLSFLITLPLSEGDPVRLMLRCVLLPSQWRRASPPTNVYISLRPRLNHDYEQASSAASGTEPTLRSLAHPYHWDVPSPGPWSHGDMEPFLPHGPLQPAPPKSVRDPVTETELARSTSNTCWRPSKGHSSKGTILLFQQRLELSGNF